MRHLTKDLKDEIEDMSGNQTKGMDVLKEIMRELSKKIPGGGPE